MKIYTIPLLCAVSINVLASEPAADNKVNNTNIVTNTASKPATIPEKIKSKTDNSIVRGAELHQAHCIACHDNMTEGNASLLYTRKDRNVSTLNGLTNQVQRCVINLKLDWFDDEIHDVSNYLNAQYYHY